MNRQAEIELLCQAAAARIEATMRAPLTDPTAPPGYVTREFACAELERRMVEAQSVLHGLVLELARRYGIAIARTAQRHFAALYALQDALERSDHA